MIEIVWKLEVAKEPDDAPSLTHALIGRDVDILAARRILELIVDQHCSWRPCSRFQPKVRLRQLPLSRSPRFREQGAPYVQCCVCAYGVSIVHRQLPATPRIWSRQPRKYVQRHVL